MKKVFTVLLALAMVLTFIPPGVLTTSAVQVGTFIYSVSNSKVTVTGYVGIGGDLTIPGTYDGYPVTAIGEKAFDKLAGLKSVTIPDSVTLIGVEAFAQCNSLITVNLGKGIISIGDFAFSDCPKLISINFGNGIIDIGDYAFCNCQKLISVIIPDSVTSIGDYAFNNCGITSLTIGSSVVSIGLEVFCYCSGLTSVTIPDSVLKIGFSAFMACSQLMQINVDDSNANYSSLEGVLFNKAKTALIQYPGGKSGAYPIPGSVTEIMDIAFAGCSGLTSVFIPDSVIMIGEASFSSTGLTSVTIPNSVTTIEIRTFFGCTDLTKINVDAANSNYSSLDGVLFNKTKTEIVQYPGGRTGAYIIPDGVTLISEKSFSRCAGLTSVTIPASVTSIGNYAFEDCENLVSAFFLGNAPETGDDIFGYFYNSHIFVYYMNGKTGFSNPWHDYPTEMFTGNDFVKIRNDDPIYGNTFNIKVGWIQFYRNISLNLTSACYISDGNYTKIEWKSNNPKVDIDNTGRITNNGMFSRSSDITVKLTSSNGTVLTDTVHVIFYKFSWQLKSLSS